MTWKQQSPDIVYKLITVIPAILESYKLARNYDPTKFMHQVPASRAPCLQKRLQLFQEDQEVGFWYHYSG